MKQDENRMRNAQSHSISILFLLLAKNIQYSII